MKTIVIIQARMGSTRLPGKVLLPLGNSVVLDYVVSRSKRMSSVQDVIVATSTLAADDAIAEWCLANNVQLTRGSEADVLDRYIQCARKYNPDYVIRVTADCPFVDYDLANDMIKQMKRTPADFIKITGELPLGLAVEMLSYAALEYVHEHGQEAYHREHVTYYVYEHPQQFKMIDMPLPVSKARPELRITLDTLEDYQLCQKIATYFKGDQNISTQQVLDYLMANPDIAKLNAHIEQRSVK